MIPTNDQVRVCLQKNIVLHVRISVMNLNENIVDKLEGLLIDGSVSIDAESNFRRQCNLKFVLASKLVPSETSAIWFNKRFRLEVGIYDWKTEEIVWFNMGIYLYDQADINISTTDRSISITGLDKMALLTGDFGVGKLDRITDINANIPIDTAIKATVTQIGKEDVNKVLVGSIVDNNDVKYTVPYAIHQPINDSVYDLIKVLTGLYRGYDFFYDENGIFRVQKSDIFKNDSISFDMEGVETDISYNIKTKLSDVKNKIVVFGKSKSDGTQPIHTLEVNEANSPFSISKIGEQKFVHTNEKLQSIEQCKSEAEYMKLYKCDLQEKVSSVSTPLFFLNVNELIHLYRPDENIDGKYKINKLNFDLGTGGQMNVDYSKVLE